jgi:hypothetical protein
MGFFMSMEVVHGPNDGDAEPASGEQRQNKGKGLSRGSNPDRVRRNILGPVYVPNRGPCREESSPTKPPNVCALRHEFRTQTRMRWVSRGTGRWRD